jgi:hypothetical protein
VEAEAPFTAVRERSALQDVALLIALGFLVAGIAGFIPGLTTNYDDLGFAGHGSGAKLFDVFQISVLHNLVHLLFGIAGIVLSRTRATARAYLVGGGAIYIVLFLYGLFTSQGSAANFVPLDHHDDILHLSLGAAMLVFGLVPERPREGTTETLAGFLASVAIFVAAIGVAYRPLRLIPPAILLALIAVGIGGRTARLSAAAVFIAGACFVIGLAAAVATSHPLW